MTMLCKQQNRNDVVPAARDESTRKLAYDQAYSFSLELCNDPRTARLVATRFVETMRRNQNISDEKGGQQ